MFCGGCNGVSKESGKQARAVWTGDDVKRPDESGNTILNPEEVVKRKTEKRKLEDELKEVDAERKALVKEMKKLAAERNKVLNKRKLYIRSKNENVKLEEKISNQKKVWLSKQLRNKGVDGPAILKEVADMVEKLVGIQEEAQREWDKINKIRTRLKDRRGKVDEAREQLTVEQEKLREEKEEFEKTTGECNKRIEETYTEQQRLKDLDVDIWNRQENVKNQSKRYDDLDIAIKSRVEVVNERELVINSRDAELKRENSLVDNITQKMYSSMEKKRAMFNRNFILLTAEYFKWASGYSDLFDGTEKEIPYTAAVKEAENILQDNEAALEKLEPVTLAQLELMLGSRKTVVEEGGGDLAERSLDLEPEFAQIPNVGNQICDDSNEDVIEKVTQELDQVATSKVDIGIVHVNEIEEEKGVQVESQDEKKQEGKLEEEAEVSNKEILRQEVLEKVAPTEESRVIEEQKVINQPGDDQLVNTKIETETEERVLKETDTPETKEPLIIEKTTEILKEEPDEIKIADAQEPQRASPMPTETAATQNKEPEPVEEANRKETEKVGNIAEGKNLDSIEELDVAEPMGEQEPEIKDQSESKKAETIEENLADEIGHKNDDSAVSPSIAEKSQEAKDTELEEEITKDQDIELHKAEPKEANTEIIEELTSDVHQAVVIEDEVKTEVEVSRGIEEADKKTCVLPKPETMEEKPVVNGDEIAYRTETPDDVKLSEPADKEKEKSKSEEPLHENEDEKSIKNPVVEHEEQASNVLKELIPKDVAAEAIEISKSKPDVEKGEVEDEDMKSVEDTPADNGKEASEVLKEPESEVIKQHEAKSEMPQAAATVEHEEQAFNVLKQPIPSDVAAEAIEISKSKPDTEKGEVEDTEIKSVEDTPADNGKEASGVPKEPEPEVIQQRDESKSEMPQAAATESIPDLVDGLRTESGVMQGTMEMDEPIFEVIQKHDDPKGPESVNELEVTTDAKVTEEKELDVAKEPVLDILKDVHVGLVEEVIPTSEDSKELVSGEAKNVEKQKLEVAAELETVERSEITEVKKEVVPVGVSYDNGVDSKEVEEELSKQQQVEAKVDFEQDTLNDSEVGKEPQGNERLQPLKEIKPEDGKEREAVVADAEKPQTTEEIDQQVELTKEVDVSKELEPQILQGADEEVIGVPDHDGKKELEVTKDSNMPYSKPPKSKEKSSSSVEGILETKEVDEDSKPDFTEVHQETAESKAISEPEANVPEYQEIKDTEECAASVDKLDENLPESEVLTEMKEGTSSSTDKLETKEVEEAVKPETTMVSEQLTDESRIVPGAESSAQESKNEVEECSPQKGDNLKTEEVADIAKSEDAKISEKVIEESIPAQPGHNDAVNQGEDTKEAETDGNENMVTPPEDSGRPEIFEDKNEAKVADTKISKQVIEESIPTQVHNEAVNRGEDTEEAKPDENENIVTPPEDPARPEKLEDKNEAKVADTKISEQAIEESIPTQQGYIEVVNQGEDTKEAEPDGNENIVTPPEDSGRPEKLEEAKVAVATVEQESGRPAQVKDLDVKGISESSDLAKSEECKAVLNTGAQNTDAGEISESRKSSSPEVIVCDEDRTDAFDPEEKEVEVLETAAPKIEDTSETNTGKDGVNPLDESRLVNVESDETPVPENEKKLEQPQEPEQKERGDEVTDADASVPCKDLEQKAITEDTVSDDNIVLSAEPDQQKVLNAQMESKQEDAISNLTAIEQKPDVGTDSKENDVPPIEQQAEELSQTKSNEITIGNVDSDNPDVPKVTSEEPKVITNTALDSNTGISQKPVPCDDYKEEERQVVRAEDHDTKEPDTVNQQVEAVADDSVIKPLNE